MLHSPLLRAWLFLVGLTGITALTAVSTAGADLSKTARMAVGILILLLAVAKARIILARYLGLSQVTPVLRGFTVILLLYMVLLAGLYVAPYLT